MKKRCDWRPVDNLRSCVVSRPPLVLFTACLLMVAAALVYGGLYVRTHDIENPDISWDWSRLLLNMKQLSFCVSEQSGSASQRKLPQKMADLYWLLQQTSQEVNLTSSSSSSLYSSHSVLLTVTVYEPTAAFFQHNVTAVSASVSASDLGLRGNLSQENVNITMFIDVFNATGRMLKTSACVVLVANKDVFPTTRAPLQCTPAGHAVQAGFHASSGDAAGATQKSDVLTAVVSHASCHQPSRIETNYENDQDLTVMLTEAEKDLVHVHLIYSSYFMFLMVFAVFVYGLVKNKGARHFSRLPSISKDDQAL